MTLVLVNSRKISIDTLKQAHYQQIIEALLVDKTPHPPKTKLLKGMTYLGYPVYRAKLDNEEKGLRLIYTFIPHQGQPCLFVLGTTMHNYNQVKRLLTTTGITQAEELDISTSEQSASPSGEIEYQSSAAYPHAWYRFDESQQQAITEDGPILYVGPAGAGKTLVLDTVMNSHLSLNENPAVASSASSSAASDRSLFLSQSTLLLNLLKAEHIAPDAESSHAIQFSTWRDILATAFPGCTEVTHEQFKTWLSTAYPCEDAEQVHFELSLIVAYGAKAYLNLIGERQSYYSGQKAQQQQLIELLKKWQSYLQKNSFFDPMTSVPVAGEARRIYCDEGQNFPPSALDYFIKTTQGSHFYITFDCEQSLTSPFTYAFIKARLQEKWGKNSEQALTLTWRNPPAVVEVMNHFMQQKHRWEGNHHKRPYNRIVSAHQEKGLVCSVTKKSLSALKGFAQYASTVVIAELPEDKTQREAERQLIINQLGTHQILDASTVIGMNFEQVILWKPLSLKQSVRQLFSKKSTQNNCSLEQWIALNAIQIALGRAQKNVFIYEPDPDFKDRGIMCFGELSVDNLPGTAPAQDEEAIRKEWKERIAQYITEGEIAIARELLQHKLNMAPKEIDSFLIQSDVAIKPQQPQNQHHHRPQKPSMPATKKTTRHPRATSSNHKKKANTKQSTTSAGKQAPNPVEFLTNPDNLKKMRQNVENNIELAKGISKEILNYQHAEGNVMVTWLYLVVSTTEGLILLNTLLDKVPTLARDISTIELISAQTSVGGNMDISCLYQLTRTPMGLMLLERLLRDNPDLLADGNFWGRDLCAPRSLAAGAEANTSPFYWLAQTIEGQRLLNELLTRNSGLASGIMASALLATGADANTSPLARLKLSPIGQQILTMLSSANPNLAKVISGTSKEQTSTTATEIAHLPLSFHNGAPRISISLQANNPVQAKAGNFRLFTVAPEAGVESKRNVETQKLAEPSSSQASITNESRQGLQPKGSPQELPTQPSIEESLQELKIPTPWVYTMEPAKKMIGDRLCILDASLSCVSPVLPPQPLNPVFFNYITFEPIGTSKKEVRLYLDLNHPKVQTKTTLTEMPMSLKQVMEQHPVRPTMTQLVHLVMRICKDVDSLPLMTAFYPSLDSIFITNPSLIGQDRPLEFRFCPSALLLTKELAPGIKRHMVHGRMLAQLCLLLGTQSTHIDASALAATIKQGWVHSPGFMAAFTEFWDMALAEKRYDTSPKVTDLSPTLNIFSNAPKECTLEAMPALLSRLACHDSIHLHGPAAESLWRFIQKEKNPNALRLLAQSIEALVPKTSGSSALLTPDSNVKNAPWILRMRLIAEVLQNLAKTGQYEQLQQVQQRLITAGICNNLGSNLETGLTFTFNVLVPTVTVSTWMAFQNDTMRLRLIFDNNVRKMSRFLLDAVPQKIINASEANRYILMMLLMSDFTTWIKPDDPQHPIDKQLQDIWDAADESLFLLDALPACPASLSISTSQAVARKLESIIMSLMQKGQYKTAAEQSKLQYCLDHLCHFTWNGHAQAAVNSHSSLYTSHFISLVFKKPAHTIFYKATPQQYPQLNTLDAAYQWMKRPEAQADYPLASVVRKIHKFPLRANDLRGFIPSHKDTSVAQLYQSSPNQGGAPNDVNAAYLNVPPHSGIIYHQANNGSMQLNAIRSLLPKELHEQGLKFTAQTLTTTQHICSVVAQGDNKGTQGLYEVNVVDAGQRELLIGLTWDKASVSPQTIPGSAANSIALDANGYVHYLDTCGKQVTFPYTAPIHSSSRVRMGISGRQVYFCVNDTFYPPIPDLLLPPGANVHPLVRIATPGVKINTRVMTSLWNLDKNDDGILINSGTNPLAYTHYQAELKTRVCPHYHGQHNNRQQALPQITALLNDPQQLANLPADALQTLLLIVLAQKTCTAETCLTPNIVRKIIDTEIQASQPGSNRPEILNNLVIDLAKQLELPELATLLQSKTPPQQPSQLNHSSFFNSPKETQPKAEPSNAQAPKQ